MILVASSFIILMSLNQRAALEWVQENIAAFGGDPERVILFCWSSNEAFYIHVDIFFLQYFNPNKSPYHQGDSCGWIRGQFLSFLPSRLSTFHLWLTTFPQDHWTKWGGYKPKSSWLFLLIVWHFYWLFDIQVGGLSPSYHHWSPEEGVSDFFKGSSLRERFIEKKEEKNWKMSVLPLHLPTYSKNWHFSLFFL